MLQAQHDPGPRTDTAGAGGPLPTLNSDEQNLFLKALAHFREINSVDGKVDGEESIGLGPTFNGNLDFFLHRQSEESVKEKGPGKAARPARRSRLA